MGTGLGRGKLNTALAVPVHVVFALLGKELDRPRKPIGITAGDGGPNTRIAQLGREQVGFTTQFGGRMGI